MVVVPTIIMILSNTVERFSTASKHLNYDTNTFFLWCWFVVLNTNIKSNIYLLNNCVGMVIYYAYSLLGVYFNLIY